MSVTTLRPNATGSTFGVTASAGTMLGCVTDNDDATYLVPSGPFWYEGRLANVTPDPYTYIKRYRIKVRYDTNAGTGGATLTNMLVFARSTSGIKGLQMSRWAIQGSMDSWVSTWVAGEPPGLTDLTDKCSVWVAFDGNPSLLKWPRVGELYLDIDVVDAPTTTVSEPTGTVVNTSRPPIVFDYNSAEGYPMTAYQIAVFDSTTYGASGFDPDDDIDSAVWNSGKVSKGSPPEYVIPGADLVDGTTYKAYVRVYDSSGNYGPWGVGSAFTMAVVHPAKPTLTAAVDNTNAKVNLTIQAYHNILDTDTSTLEDAIGNWTVAGLPGANCAVARTTDQAEEGTHSLEATSTAAGDMYFAAGMYAVHAGTQYTFRASVRAATDARSVYVGVSWLDTGFSVISTSTGTASNDSTSAWGGRYVTATAPVGAVNAVLAVYVVGTGAGGEVHYADKASFHPGAGTAWAVPGTTDHLYWRIQRSYDSGTTWEDVRGSLEEVMSARWQYAIVYDYEARLNIDIVYRAFSSGVVDTGGYLTSLPSDTSSVMNIDGGDCSVWLKDPLYPALNMQVDLAQDYLDRSDDEQVAFYRAFERGQPIAVADANVGAGKLENVKFEVRSEDELDSLRALRLAQRTLLMQRAQTSEQWYVRFAPHVQWRETNYSPSLRRLNSDFYIVDAP